MKEHLELVAKSYDKGIDLGRKGIDSYQSLPPHITNNPNYTLYLKMRMNETLSDSGQKEIVEYLSPKKGMNFIDLGCCLNLMFRGYNEWPSTYYGVDISEKSIELLQEFVHKNHVTIGSLYCGSMHVTPYAESFIDIGACIGSLEYFEKDFVKQAIAEAHRIMKPEGKYILDIPDIGSPEFQITALIEDYLGRTDRYNISNNEFETILMPYFKVVKKEKMGPMIQYFLTCTK